MNPMPDTYVDLFFGYTALWLLIGWFVFRLSCKHRELHTELVALKNSGAKS